MAYTDKALALAAVQNLPAVRSLPVADDSQFLNDLLTASAGRVPAAGAIRNEEVFAGGALVYRHYFVAARYLETLRSQHILESGQGAKFTGLRVPIASLMSLQLADDLSLGLEVPLGYEAEVAIAEAGGGGATIKPFIASRSSRSRILP